MRRDKLFILGDSFGSWPFPEGQHWSNLIEQEYDVYNYAHGGAAYAEICFQSAYIQGYRLGDRLVVVLPEPTRISKYLRKAYEDGMKEQGGSGLAVIHRDEKLEEFLVNPSHFIKRFEKHEPGFKDHTLADWFFIYKLQFNFSVLNPLYITWNPISFKLGSKLLKNLYYISPDQFTTLSDEGLSPENIPDYHPGIEGNKVWYKYVKRGLKKGGLYGVRYV